jgi:SAM-dependent methyltransferase
MDSHAWDERYADQDLVWSAGPNRFLADEVGDMAPGRALDLACGEGRNAIWLASRGWRVVAVDFSPVGIDKGRQRADHAGVTVDWMVADVTAWDPPGLFDLIAIFYLQLNRDELTTTLSHALPALAPGATLLVVAHDRRNLTEGVGGPQDPAVLVDPDELTSLLPGLDIERATTVERVVDGADRPALDALVRARRPG